MNIEDLQLKKAIRESLDRGGVGTFRIEEIPTRKMYDLAERIENHYLPKLRESRGPENEDYKFFNEVFRCLVYSVLLVDRWEFLNRTLSRIDLENKLLRDRSALAEKELLKYTTMEDLWTTDALDRVARNVASRLNDLGK